MEITAIVFDMGNVLVIDDLQAFARAYTDHPAEVTLLVEEVIGSSEWAEWDRGTILVPDAARAIAARMPAHLARVPADMMARWHRELVPMPGMEALIRRLKGAGHGIYLLSNTGLSYYDYRAGLPAIDCFDGEYVTAEYHFLKPERAVYDSFCETFRLSPGQCFFVDDKAVNIQGAVDAGWQGFVFGGDIAALEAALAAAGVRG